MALALGLGGLALVTSFVNGLLGAGGAVLLIPMALYVLPLMVGSALDPHVVSGLVLVQSVASAIGGGIGFRRHGRVDRRLVLEYGPVLSVGGLSGAIASARLAGDILLLAFAIITSATAVLMLAAPAARPAGASLPSHNLLAGALLFLIAVLGGAIGIGAAFLIIPVMLYLLGTEPRTASGTALVLSVFLTGPALLGKAATGQIIWMPAACMAVAGLIGSQVGAHFSQRVAVGRLRVLLAVLIAVLAIRVWMSLLA